MARPSPDITVVIPTYNRQDYLANAVRSCFDGNAGIAIELVVVDDGSTDGTREWLKSRTDSRIRAILQDHQGPQAARNRGLDEAKGRRIKFLDDDDWLTAGTLEREVRRMDETGADLCAGDALVWRDGVVVERYRAPDGEDPFCDLATGDAMAHPLKFTLSLDLARRARWRWKGVELRDDLAYMIHLAGLAERYCRLEEPSGYFRQHEGVRLSESLPVEASRTHLRILCDVGRSLLEAEPSASRVDALRLGLWRWIHLVFPHDRDLCHEAWTLLESLRPGDPYLPPRNARVLRLLDRALGPMAVERIQYYPRKLKQRLPRAQRRPG